MIKPFLVDTHAHIDLFDRLDVPDVLMRATTVGVGRIISVAINLDSALQALRIATANPGVFATVGIHPYEAAAVDEALIKYLGKIGKENEVVAVGETGLDYHNLKATKKAQIDGFKRHIDLASKLGLPLIIHCRDAYEDLLKILDETRPPNLVLHCFSGNVDHLPAFLELGCFISLTGVVTFKNAGALRAVAAEIPIDRLLLETDSPYLAPQKRRGQRNEPSYIRFTAEKISEIKKMPLEALIKETTSNADKLFGDYFSDQTLFDAR